ncbi:hypothetical protein GCM10022297_16580 [Lactobacillus hamsteri]|uniref:Rib/alpha-like domain-containing protein n=1 Tax=Lactobacillus hamsteri TaxID=96565 RepID=UPI000469C217|nr:Rib/alpha-like domain-containing protein [Lactobacillus hamsteri]
MVFDCSKEPTLREKVKIVSSNGQDVNLYNSAGVKQTHTRKNGEVVSVFEVKEINGKIFYRIGGQTEWLAKEDTNWNKAHVEKESKGLSRFTNNDLSENVLPDSKQKHESQNSNKANYDLSVKKGLVIAKGSPVPAEKDLKKVFKNGKDFPEDTKYQWIYPPDTDQNKYTNAKIKVIFPDGTTGERSVHYSIQNNAQNSIQTKNPTKPVEAKKALPNSQPEFVNPQPEDLDFSFIANNSLMKPFYNSINEALTLYKQAFYKQMSNTIRQGLEMITDDLLSLNQINPGPDWNRAILSNQLGYIAHLRLLPQRIMNLCFSIKNYGNIGSHNNKVARFNQASALADLQQYHDLLVYLVNTYQHPSKLVAYADIQITDEQNKHRNWYQKPRLNPVNIISFRDYMYQKDHPVPKKTQPVIIQQPTQPIQITQAIPVQPEPEPSRKMGKGMKFLTWCFAIIGIIVLAGIGYEFLQLNSNQSQNSSQQAKTSIKSQARNLTNKQTVALSLVYADMKLDGQWQSAYDQVESSNYNVSRYKDYTFGDATVTAQGKNYVYVLEKDVGFGFQDKSNGDRLVTFFDPDQNDPKDNPVHVYTYQMLRQIKSNGEWNKVKKIANELSFTDEEIN